MSPVALALVVATAAAAVAEESSVDVFFEDFAARRNAIQTLDAHFVQTTITPDELVVSEGTIVYARPKRLIFRYSDPPLEYMIDGLRAYEYDPELEQLQIFELENRPESEAFYLGFEDDAARLTEAYSVRLVPPANAEEHAIALEFTPKPKPDEEPYFRRVTLQLRRGDFLPAAIEIINDEDSSVLFEVSDYRINPEISPDQTHIQLPEGTDIVENDSYVETVGPQGMLVPRPAEARAAPEARVQQDDLP